MKMLFIIVIFLNTITIINGQSTFNNPYLELVNCSGVRINDTISSSWTVLYGDGSLPTTDLFHQYLSPGNYILKYKTFNPVDSFFDTIPIVIPTTPVFPYSTPISGGGIGISKFILNTINKTSGFLKGGALFTPILKFDDFTCSDQTVLYEDFNYPVTIITDSNFSAIVTIFLDLNSDGYFGRDEILGHHFGFINHNFNIVIPRINDSLLNQQLRLRVVSANSNIPFYLPNCSYRVDDIEDYTVVIPNHSSVAPNAFFYYYHSYDGLAVQFRDASTGGPQNITWYFPDGTTSNSRIPQFNFQNIDSQVVSLVVSNNYGFDSTVLILDNPIKPKIFRSDPIIPFQLDTFYTNNYPNIINWWWTFPEVPVQSTQPIAYHTYTTTGVFPITLSIMYLYFNYFYTCGSQSWSGRYCNGITDDSVSIFQPGIFETGHLDEIIIFNYSEYENIIQIKSKYNGNVKAKIYEILGREEDSFEMFKSSEILTAKLSTLNSGLHLVSIEFGNRMFYKKFVSIK